MASIYSCETIEETKRPETGRLDETMSSLLTSGRATMIKGIEPILEGTLKWTEFIAEERRILEHNKVPEDRIAKHCSGYEGKDVMYEGISVNAMNYNLKRLLYDEGAAICEIIPLSKQIHVFWDLKGHSHGILTSWTNFARYEGRKLHQLFYHDYTFPEALSGFEENGFGFTLWGTTWFQGNIKEDGSFYESLEKYPCVKGATLKDVLEFADKQRGESS